MSIHKRKNPSRYSWQVLLLDFIIPLFIEKSEHKIDSLSKLSFDNPYQGVSEDKILLQPIQCKFSYLNFLTQTQPQDEAVFYIDPVS